VSETLSTGDVLSNRYRLVRVIGSGGMGSVYLAWDLVLNRRVVIKGLIDSADPDIVAQSVMEREFLARINHSNIVAIYDFITQGNHGYIVMEYVDGKTLDQMLEERGTTFDAPTAIHYILQILPAFAYLARLNLVYCDFKPQNVMVGQLKDGTQILKLIDLGTVIAYGPKPQRVYGTHGFYAREAIKSPSPLTDLYSICRTLAYLVTTMDLDDPIFGMPPASRYPVFQSNPALYTLLQKGTHNDPARRFQSADELEEQLRGVLRLCEGGLPGVPVDSRHFVSTSLTNTGRVGRRGESMLDENDRAINLLRQGDQAFQLANYVGAEVFYQQAGQLNPQSLDAHARTIDLLIEQGNLTQAANELVLMQGLSRTHWKVRWCEGRIMEACEQWKQAEACYMDVIFDQPGELPPLQALARIRVHHGQDDEAIRIYQSVLKADPGNVDATFGLAECLLRQQRWSEAIRCLSNLSEATFRYAEAQLLLCDIYLNQSPVALPDAQDIQEAAHVVRRLKGRTDDARYYLAHAEIYYMAWYMAQRGLLPVTIRLPDVSRTDPPTLGAVANASYTEYLKREQELAPREDILRRKFEVAPWHIV
jgi:serine/threonine-protein kinase PknG